MGFLRSPNVEDLQQKKQVAWGLGKEFYDWYCWIQDLSCQFNTKRKMLPLDKIIDNHIAFSELILSGGPITGTGSPTFTSPKWGSEAGLCIKSGLEKLRKFSNGQRKMTFIEYRSVFEKLFEGETLVTQEDDFTQRITASLNRFNGKLLVRYDGYFEDYGNSIFSDLHFCSLTPGEQQF